MMTSYINKDDDVINYFEIDFVLDGYGCVVGRFVRYVDLKSGQLVALLLFKDFIARFEFEV